MSPGEILASREIANALIEYPKSTDETPNPGSRANLQSILKAFFLVPASLAFDKFHGPGVFTAGKLTEIPVLQEVRPGIEDEKAPWEIRTEGWEKRRDCRAWRLAPQS
jgi:hypothetical protein